MDTEHIVAIAVGVVLLLVICFFLFLFVCGGSALAWVLARRRAHPNYEEIHDTPKACDCPPAKTHCVGAEYDEDDGKLVAVRVRRDGSCCGSGGRFNRHRLQRLVDRTDELLDEAKDQELFGQVARMAAGMSGSRSPSSPSSSGAPVPRGATP